MRPSAPEYPTLAWVSFQSATQGQFCTGDYTGVATACGAIEGAGACCGAQAHASIPLVAIAAILTMVPVPVGTGAAGFFESAGFTSHSIRRLNN
jgi:hypothetical protein